MNSIICFRWAKRPSINAIQTEMPKVCGDKCFTRQAIHVWCKQFAHGHESVDEERFGRRVVSTTNATIASVDSLMRSDWRVIG